MPTEQEIIDSHTLIVETFKSFRPELMQAYGKIEHLSKHDTSPVTELDITIETVVKEKLLAAFPQFGIQGEETEKVESQNGATWYIDPIDGTSSFIHGLPYCSNMAGLVVDGEITASIIYHFAADELFTAFRGKGAFKNGEAISVKNTPLNDSFVFGTSFVYKNIYPFYSPHQVKFYAPVGAAGYFLTRVAQGSTQGACFYHSRLKQHDVIPGALLIQEAGGEMISLSGEEFDHNCLSFMAGTPNICELTRQYLDEIVQLPS